MENAVNAVGPTIWIDLTVTIPERGESIYINLLDPEVHQNKGKSFNFCHPQAQSV